MTAAVPPATPHPHAVMPAAVPGGGSSAAPTSAPVTSSQVPTSVVAVALARLDGVHALPLHEQPDLYQAVHSELQSVLAAIDNA